jgi:hypothetical protein
MVMMVDAWPGWVWISAGPTLRDEDRGGGAAQRVDAELRVAFVVDNAEARHDRPDHAVIDPA